MRKSLGVVLFLALLFMAVRMPNSIAIATFLNGEPSPVGVLTSAGASVTNASTAVPFVLTGVTFRAITVQCDATTFVGFGSTCGTTTATSNGCFIIRATDPPKVIFLQDATTAMNAAGGAAFNCIVNKLL